MWAYAQRDGRPAEYRWCPLVTAVCVCVCVCVCVRVSACLSVPRRIPTLLHGPGCNFEEW